MPPPRDPDDPSSAPVVADFTTGILVDPQERGRDEGMMFNAIPDG
jgi:hypothetical protein